MMSAIEPSARRCKKLRTGSVRTGGGSRTPHPGPLPVEGRGGPLPDSIYCATSGAPSPLNGERAGVRGATAPVPASFQKQL